MKNKNDISKKIATLMIDKKAIDVKIIKLEKITTLTDYFIICTSESDPQTRAIFNHIKDELIKENLKAWRTEGYEHLNWVVMDYINFVNHYTLLIARNGSTYNCKLCSSGIINGYSSS